MEYSSYDLVIKCVCAYQQDHPGIGEYILKAILDYQDVEDSYVIIHQLLNAGVDINTRNKKGQTLLHLASFDETIQELIVMGADVNIQDDKGNTPLHYHVKHMKNSDIIDTLINYGADLNATNNKGQTALHLCTDYEIMELLIDNGADLNIQDVDGKTVLHYNPTNIDIVKMLLARGIDRHIVDNEGKKGTWWIFKDFDEEEDDEEEQPEKITPVLVPYEGKMLRILIKQVGDVITAGDCEIVVDQPKDNNDGDL